MGLGKHGIQESSRVDRALAIVERDDYADIQSLRSKDMRVRAVFHLGIVTHWSKVICLPNDIYPTVGHVRLFSKFARPSLGSLNFEGLDLDWQSTSRRFTWRDGSVVGGGISLHSQHNVSPGSLYEMVEAAGAVVTPEEAQSFM